MTATAVRPQVQVAALAALVVAAESAVLASRAFAAHPAPFRAAVIFDLAVVPAALFWLLVVRRGLARPRTVARVAAAGILVSALLFGREVRLLAAPLELALIWIAVTSVRRALAARTAADPASALRSGLTSALGDNLAARAVASEFSLLWYALLSWGRPAPAGFTAYKRAGWPAIHGAFIFLCIVEGTALHFLFVRWGPVAAAAGATLHVYTILWLVGDLRALALRPIRVEGGKLLLRIGLRWEADVPLDQIAAVERSPAPGLKLGVLGAPNLVLKLRQPHELHGMLGRRKSAQTLLLQVDEPEALSAEISRQR